MTKFYVKLLGFFIFFFLIVTFTKNAYAATITLSEQVSERSRIVTVTFSDLIPNVAYSVFGDSDYQSNLTGSSTSVLMYMCHFEDTGLNIKPSILPGCSQDYSYFEAEQNHKIELKADLLPDDAGGIETVASLSFTVSRYIPTISYNPTSGFAPGDDITINISGSREPKSLPKRNNYQILIYGEDGTPRPSINETCFNVLNDGSNNTTFNALPSGNYRIEVKEQVRESETCSGGFRYRSIRFTVRDGGGEVISDENGSSSGAGANPCTTGPDGRCPTALGNLPITVKGLANRILQIGIGVAGGIALILIVIGAIRVLVSQGDQQKLNGGREMIVAAVAGLLFLIFATLILQFIGINILKGVPGIGL